LIYFVTISPSGFLRGYPYNFVLADLGFAMSLAPL
jgi:hypothetical protein